MKKLSGLAVLLILLVFPAISYYYLHTGFKYRKEQLTEMELKGDFMDMVGTSQTTYKTALADSIEDRITVLYSRQANGIDTTILHKLKEQFKNNAFFHYREVPSEDIQMKGEFADKDFFLINRDGQILNSYKYSEDSMKDLIAHTAISLPFEKRKKIKLKRQLKDENLKDDNNE